MGGALIWGLITRESSYLGYPNLGPYNKGILLFGGLCEGSPFSQTPKPQLEHQKP